MGKNIGKNISKNLSGKYSLGMLAMCQKLLNHAKKSAIDALKTSSKRVIQKNAEANGGLIGNEIANAVAKSYDGKITKAPKNSQENNSEIRNGNDKEMTKERYISPEERQKIIDNVR